MKIATFCLKVVLSVLFTGIFSFAGFCQNLIDNDISTLFSHNDSVKQDYKKPLRSTDNEINLILSSGFLIYKNYVSSQDKPSCVFTPSCSEFAVVAFQKKGVVNGWLMTFDRLSRCHGFVKPTDYPFDEQKQHFYDPVE